MPGSPFAAALALQRQGRLLEAEQSYAAIQTGPSAAASANNRAALLQARGAVAESINVWHMAVELSPAAEVSHNNLASALLQSGEQRKAWDVLRRAVKTLPESAALYSRLGAVLTAGQPMASLPPRAQRTAASIARVAARLSRHDGGVWINFGLALAAVGQPDGANLAYRHAVELSPMSAEARLGLASTQPEPAEAICTLRAAIALSPQLSGPISAVYYNLGNLLHHHRHRAAAGNLSQAWPAQPGDRLETAATAAKLMARVTAEAVVLFEAASRLQPSLSNAYYNAGLAPQQSHIDKPEQSLTAYRHALALTPRDAKVWSRLVTTLSWAGREAEATHAVETAISAGIWVHSLQRPSLLVPGLKAQAWHAAFEYRSLWRLLRDGHDALVAGWRSAALAMHPQHEGLEEAGGEWLVYDLGAACSTDAHATYDHATYDHATHQHATYGLIGDGIGADGFSANALGDDDRTAYSSSMQPVHARAGSNGAERVRHSIQFALAPVCEVLHEIRTAGRRASIPFEPLKAQYSQMAPGVHVRPHTGPTNAKLTVHYGLSVSAGARIRVGEETRPFEERGLLVFDDSFEHEVRQALSSVFAVSVPSAATPNPTLPPTVELHTSLGRYGKRATKYAQRSCCISRIPAWHLLTLTIQALTREKLICLETREVPRS